MIKKRIVKKIKNKYNRVNQDHCNYEIHLALNYAYTRPIHRMMILLACDYNELDGYSYTGNREDYSRLRLVASRIRVGTKLWMKRINNK